MYMLLEEPVLKDFHLFCCRAPGLFQFEVQDG